MTDASKLSQQWLELFRAGDYGAKGKFTVQDIDHIVKSYDPSFHEAPLVIGHPESNKPAYGWVEQLKREGEVLLFKPRQVDPAFEDGVAKGRFKKRSASFYKRADGYHLRHVGFLGAKPPDVKGLADAVFHDEGSEFFEIDFEEDEEMSFDEKGFFERLGEFLKGTRVATAAEVKSFSEDDVKRIAADAAKVAVTEAVKPLETTITAQQAKITKFEEDQKTAKISTAAKDAVARLKSAGRWIPAFDKMGLVQVFDELAKSTVTIEFGEGEAKKTLAPVEVLASFVEGLPKIVPGGRVALGKVEGGKVVAFAENPGSKVGADENSVRLNDLAVKRQKEKSISFSDALSQVVSEHPELTEPAAMTAGAV
jgi:hypothetical protein